MPIDALSALCAQLTRDLLAIAKFLFHTKWHGDIPTGTLITGASDACRSWNLQVGRNRNCKPIYWLHCVLSTLQAPIRASV